MTDKTADLIAYAKEIAPTTDLFSILGVDATSTNDEIHRAWRRTGLKYHPDKAGDAYDPEKYEGITRARDVLLDPAAREVYDRARAAALENQRRKDEMSAGRRRMIEELEAAERAARGQGGLGTGQQQQEKLSAEEARQRQEAMRAWEDVKRKRREAEESERLAASEKEMKSRAEDAERDAREAAIEQKLRENAEKKAAKARRKAEKEGVPLATHSDVSPSIKDQGPDDAMAAVRQTVADATRTATLARESGSPALGENLSSSIEKTRDSAKAATSLVMAMGKEPAAHTNSSKGDTPWSTTKAKAAAYQTWRDATAAFLSAHSADGQQDSAYSREKVLAATEKTLQSAQKTEQWLRQALEG
ncbi:hypothetical protein MCOR27_005457 [Pyricularia oryzae]|uniref:J domain-containing protein n=1 Tax=Pyricularia grisea TaxID=148305 RepID=A0ABQ8N3D4_PYRGI|nr:hypothetical protein MCOR02_008305 [Pyricularia oryzae]KAI6290582.1 hypothetical protein MCOR33_011204 [Pyricularia grisea]KAI6256494.1 hypothetical protein MCOR19_007065 [Pyricularia oryzae]KAI6263924.1 hypothetical protein MCOR26_011731 [Pyricularia oryzae]KAI6278805.1 hypothetical protein MCOR27_005457 [Pyricularia oryzae]